MKTHCLYKLYGSSKFNGQQQTIDYKFLCCRVETRRMPRGNFGHRGSFDQLRGLLGRGRKLAFNIIRNAFVHQSAGCAPRNWSAALEFLTRVTQQALAANINIAPTRTFHYRKEWSGKRNIYWGHETGVRKLYLKSSAEPSIREIEYHKVLFILDFIACTVQQRTVRIILLRLFILFLYNILQYFYMCA